MLDRLKQAIDWESVRMFGLFLSFIYLLMFIDALIRVIQA